MQRVLPLAFSSSNVAPPGRAVIVSPHQYRRAVCVAVNRLAIVRTVFTGSEIADLCEYEDDANDQPPGSKYMLQRTWANAAARAGGDVLKLTITVKSYNPSFGGAGVVIESSLGGQDNLTVIAVGQ